MTAPVPSESGARQRTRQAIIVAALNVWARDWSASLGDIADRASVSRSTLHRYFTDRQALVDATKEHATAALEESASKSMAQCSTPGEMLDALMRATIDVGDAVIFLFADPNRFADAWEDEDTELRGIVERAQHDGTVLPDVSADWVISVFYSLLYVAAECVNTGSLPRHRAGEIAVRTFFGGVGTAR